MSGSHLSTRRPPAIGDIAPDCVLPLLDGTRINLRADGIAGNPIVLVFCPKSAPSVAQALSEFSARYGGLEPTLTSCINGPQPSRNSKTR